MPELVYDWTRENFIETDDPELIELERRRANGEPVDYDRMGELCRAHKSTQLPRDFDPTHAWRTNPGERARAAQDPNAVMRHYMARRPGLRRLDEVGAPSPEDLPGEKVAGGS